jgi:fibronectin type 3 domain-containing protein
LIVGNETDNSLDLTWDAVAGASGYRVYRSDDGGDTFFQVGDDIEDGITTYSDTTLTPGTIYWYSVSTFDEIGEGPLSDAVSGTTTGGS